MRFKPRALVWSARAVRLGFAAAALLVALGLLLAREPAPRHALALEEARLGGPSEAPRASREAPGLAAAAAQEKPGRGKEHERVHPLVVFPRQSMDIRRWMKENGWETQRGSPRHFRVGEGSLLMVSRADSVAIGTRRGFPISVARWPRLRVRLKIETLPRGTNLARRSGDDAAFRLYVAFDRNAGLFHPPHTIAYAWTETLEPGRVIASPHFRQLRYLSVGRGLPAAPKEAEARRPARRWITIERDLAADYRRVFPEDRRGVPPLKGILLKCDSNNTGTSARARVAAVELVRPGP